MRAATRQFGAVALRLAGLVIIGLCCGSCVDEYLARRDALDPGAGNAVQSNIAVQTIDPAPLAANNTTMTTGGELVQHAMEQYRNPTRTTAAPLPPASPGNGVGAPTVR